jgi:hypothetical protein
LTDDESELLSGEGAVISTAAADSACKSVGCELTDEKWESTLGWIETISAADSACEPVRCKLPDDKSELVSDEREVISAAA